MNKIKVLQCSIANSKGGITQYVLNNWKYIDHERFIFDFLTFGETLDFKEDLEKDGCRVYFVKHRAEEDLSAFRNEIRQILKNRYDVIHLHTSFWKSFELEKLAKEAGIPKIIIHAHNSAVFEDANRDYKTLKHNELKAEFVKTMATDFWACSRDAAKWLYGDKVDEKDIIIMKNAVDTDRFSYNEDIRSQYREKLGWQDKLIIGHVGRFSYQKNHELLIKIFSQVVRYNENARLLLIGKGPLEEKIKNMVADYDLKDKVRFLGPSNEVNCYMQAMDKFCFPSRFEGLGIVLIEAQAAGLSCVVSESIPQEAFVTSNITKMQDTASLKEWADELLRDDKSLNRYAGCEAVRLQHFDIKEQILQLEKGYSAI